MPNKSTTQRAKQDLRQGKSPSTAAGEFVREEIEHVRHGKHGVRSPQQAIAIGLSEARRAGIPVKPRDSSKAGRKTHSQPESKSKTTSARRAQASTRALEREPRSTVSHAALSRQARAAARRHKATGN